MDEQAWVGPAEQAPLGWTVFPSLEALLDSPLRAERIVLDDRAAVLREADFLKVYAHSPLAQITRCVGPWRAGIGRTDPAWPLVTTCRSDGDTLDAAAWLPLTSGYDGLSAEEEPLDLSGVSVGIRIADPELRGMWIDFLSQFGADRVDEGADVLVVDEAFRRTGSAHSFIVQLRSDPWNADAEWGESNVAFRSAKESPFAERKATLGAAPTSPVIAASVLDSPTAVMRRVLRMWERAHS